MKGRGTGGPGESDRWSIGLRRSGRPPHPLTFRSWAGGTDGSEWVPDSASVLSLDPEEVRHGTSGTVVVVVLGRGQGP